MRRKYGRAARRAYALIVLRAGSTALNSVVGCTGVCRSSGTAGVRYMQRSSCGRCVDRTLAGARALAQASRHLLIRPRGWKLRVYNGAVVESGGG